jgi:hypothetical protein
MQKIIDPQHRAGHVTSVNSKSKKILYYIYIYIYIYI